MALAIIFWSTFLGARCWSGCPGVLLWGVASCLSLVCLGMALRWGRGVYVGVAMVCFCVSGLRAQYDTGPAEPDVPLLIANARLWRVRLISAVESVQSGAQERWHVRVRLLQMRQDGFWQSQKGIVRLELRPGIPVAFGDELDIVLDVSTLPQPRNATDWTPQQIRQRRRISAQARVVSAHMLVTPGGGPRAWLDRKRQHFAAQIERQAPSQVLAALGKAMLLGQSRSLTHLDRNVWADAGTAHLLAISGLHIGWLRHVCRCAWTPVLYMFVQPMVRMSLASLGFVLAEGAGFVYALFTGASWGALRATLMGMYQLGAHLYGRAPNLWPAWSLSGTLILLIWPHAVWDVAFLLSFAAVAGLLAFGRAPQQHQEGAATSMGKRLKNNFKAAWGTCVYATLATAGLCAVTFGQIPGTAAVINLFAVAWTASVILPLGWIQLLLSDVVPDSLLYGWMQSLALLHALAGMGQNFYGANLHTPALSMLDLILYLSGMCWLRYWQTHACCNRTVWMYGMAFLCGVLWCDLACTKPWWRRDGPRNELSIEHIYVGQGDATLVQLPEGTTMLVDGGGRVWGHGIDPGQHMLAPVLRHRKIRRIDIMVVSHPHPDHIQGLLVIAQKWPVHQLWLNGDGFEFASVRTLMALVQKQGGRVLRPHGRYRQDGVVIDVFAPLAGASASVNDHSLVLRLQYHRRSILLAGDIEHRAEAALCHVLPHTDILKVAHHGSRTSSHRAFLQVCKPQLAVISSGENSPFGHPHRQTLERLDKAQIPVWQLAQDGALLLRTDGARWRLQASHSMHASHTHVFEQRMSACSQNR